MKNTLTDLNNHLFAQMERLSEESLNSEQLAFEAERSKSLTIIARTIVDNARLVLDAQTRINDIPERKELPAILKWIAVALKKGLHLGIKDLKA